MKRNKRVNFKRLLVINTPKNKEVSKLISNFETMIQSSTTIVFNNENSWCMIGVPKTYENHTIIKQMINTIYSSSFNGILPWLNLIYMSVDTGKMKVKSICLLTKCHIISSAPPKYMRRVLKEVDPTMYYLRITYDESIDLLWDTELTDTIISKLKR